MKLTIKGLKSLRGREGTAYNCTLCLEGKAIATCHDDGNGGSLLIHWDKSVTRELRERIEAYAVSLPPLQHPDGVVRMDLDLLIAKLADEHERDKQLRKLCSKNTVYRMPTTAQDEWLVQKVPFSASIGAQLRAKGAVEIANERFSAKVAK